MEDTPFVEHDKMIQVSHGSTKESEQPSDMTDEAVAEVAAQLPKCKGWVLPTMYRYKGVWLDPPRLKLVLWLDQHFTPRPSDLLLATYIKVGTTWLKSLAFAVAERRRYSFDDTHHPLLNQFPHYIVPTIEYNGIDIVEGCNSETSFINVNNRIFHTHLAYNILGSAWETSKCKVVYLCRNPADTFVSLWKFLNKLRPKELGELTLEEAFEMFCDGESVFGPYWDHVLGYWKASNETHISSFLFMTYEEMQKNPTQQVKRLAEFLGFPFSEEEDEALSQIVKLCSFDNLSSLEANKNGKVLGIMDHHLFFRKGIVGDSKRYLTEEMVKRLNIITEEKFRGCGLEHVFDAE